MRRSALLPLLLTLFGTVADARVPAVVTDIPPVQSLVAQVMGDLGTPAVLLDRGGDPHEFQLRPSQAAALARADLVIWIGPELTPWLDRTLSGIGIADRAVALLRVPGTFTMNFAPGESGEGDLGLNPHAWLDPDNAAVWLDAIAADLAKADPDDAATYRANATRAKAALAAADAGAKALLAPATKAPIVVFHDAFGYFARHFGLNVAGAIALGDASKPGAARLAKIRALLKTRGAVCAFPEAAHDPKLVRVVTEGTGTRIGRPLDPVGTLLDPGPGLYAALIGDLAAAVADCVGR